MFKRLFSLFSKTASLLLFYKSLHGFTLPEVDFFFEFTGQRESFQRNRLFLALTPHHKIGIL